MLVILVGVCGARAWATNTHPSPPEPAYLRAAQHTRHALRHINTINGLARFLVHRIDGHARAAMGVMAVAASLHAPKARCVSKALALSSQSPIPASSATPSYAVEFHSGTDRRDYHKAKRYLELLYLHRTANSFANYKTVSHRHGEPDPLSTALPYLAQSAIVDAGFDRAEVVELLAPCHPYFSK